MRRYSPIIILSLAIGFVFTLSKVYQTELSILQEQKTTNTSNSNNKDIALSSIKESFNILLNFDAKLTKSKQAQHVKNVNQTDVNAKSISTPIVLDTIKKSDINSSPILMLDDLVKKENLNFSE